MSSSSLRILLALLLLTLLTPQRSSGQSQQWWCIADSNVADAQLQKSLDWVCWKYPEGCSMIQQNQPCFEPNTVRDHASYAFNSYYQKFKHQGLVGASCYFNATAHITASDPSHGSCKFECPP